MGYASASMALAANYRITIDIAPPALARIAQAGQAVTLWRGVGGVAEQRANGVAAPAEPAIAWQVFRPFQTNTVTWTEAFFGFVTVQAPRIGVVVTMNSRTKGAMREGALCTFAAGAFTAGTQVCTGFAIHNQASGSLLSFGLAQQAVVNGQAAILAPINVMPVMHGQTASFLPQQQLSVFLSSCHAGGTCIPVPTDALTLTLNGGRAWHLGFNGGTGQFYVKG